MGGGDFMLEIFLSLLIYRALVVVLPLTFKLIDAKFVKKEKENTLKIKLL